MPTKSICSWGTLNKSKVFTTPSKETKMIIYEMKYICYLKEIVEALTENDSVLDQFECAG